MFAAVSHNYPRPGARALSGRSITGNIFLDRTQFRQPLVSRPAADWRNPANRGNVYSFQLAVFSLFSRHHPHYENCNSYPRRAFLPASACKTESGRSLLRFFAFISSASNCSKGGNKINVLKNTFLCYVDCNRTTRTRNEKINNC